ncbi:hypothetical protein MVEN_00926600 [Mycena venus]|uniref:Uncharacterized protein n=1 Tax=Mycena venus TaxID=2733690 RepID=A0A8H6YCJ4_9AGAR|nr:hypothetical protein MVEN_00926600 [Mycena venus]
MRSEGGRSWLAPATRMRRIKLIVRRPPSWLVSHTMETLSSRAIRRWVLHQQLRFSMLLRDVGIAMDMLPLMPSSLRATTTASIVRIGTRCCGYAMSKSGGSYEWTLEQLVVPVFLALRFLPSILALSIPSFSLHYSSFPSLVSLTMISSSCFITSRICNTESACARAPYPSSSAGETGTTAASTSTAASVGPHEATSPTSLVSAGSRYWRIGLVNSAPFALLFLSSVDDGIGHGVRETCNKRFAPLASSFPLSSSYIRPSLLSSLHLFTTPPLPPSLYIFFSFLFPLRSSLFPADCSPRFAAFFQATSNTRRKFQKFYRTRGWIAWTMDESRWLRCLGELQIQTTIVSVVRRRMKRTHWEGEKRRVWWIIKSWEEDVDLGGSEQSAATRSEDEERTSVWYQRDALSLASAAMRIDRGCRRRIDSTPSLLE